MPAPNYRVLLSYDVERKVFHARAPELEHCAAEGGSRAEAIAKLEEEISAQVQNMAASGQQPPQPVDEKQHSGEIQLKLSKQLHRDLEWQARQEGVDVGQLAAEMLAAAMAERRSVRAPRGNRAAHDGQPHDNVGNSFGNGGGNRRGFGGGRYGQSQHLLDDRANFIEYVRTLENQGSAPHHAGAHGGHNGQPGGRNNNRRRRGGGGGGGNGPRGNGGPNGGNGHGGNGHGGSGHGGNGNGGGPNGG